MTLTDQKARELVQDVCDSYGIEVADELSRRITTALQEAAAEAAEDKQHRIDSLEKAMRMRDTFLKEDAAAAAYAEITYFLEPHFTGAKGRQMTPEEAIEMINGRVTDQADEATRVERERVIAVIERKAREYERRGDFGIIQNFVQRVIAANEITSAITATEEKPKS